MEFIILAAILLTLLAVKLVALIADNPVILLYTFTGCVVIYWTLRAIDPLDLIIARWKLERLQRKDEKERIKK